MVGKETGHRVVDVYGRFCLDLFIYVWLILIEGLQHVLGQDWEPVERGNWMDTGRMESDPVPTLRGGLRCCGGVRHHCGRWGYRCKCGNAGGGGGWTEYYFSEESSPLRTGNREAVEGLRREEGRERACSGRGVRVSWWNSIRECRLEATKVCAHQHRECFSRKMCIKLKKCTTFHWVWGLQGFSVEKHSQHFISCFPVNIH